MGKQKWTEPVIAEMLQKEGYELLGLERRASGKKRSGTLLYITMSCSHGHETTVYWPSWLKGHRCKTCGYGLTVKKRRKPFDAIAEAFEAEGYTLKVSANNYRNSGQRLACICPEGHECRVAWDHFKQGGRCPVCGNGNKGFDASKPARLYYLRLDTPSGPVYKIGMTSNTVWFRYSRENIKYTVLLDQRYETSRECRDVEQSLLRQHAAQKYTGPALLSSGNTELFSADVLGLDSHI